MTRSPQRLAAAAPAMVHPTRGRRAGGAIRSGLLPLGAALLAALAATGCDNPACVFSPTQCQPDDGTGGPGGIGSFSAVFPNDVSWLAPSAPTVMRSGPSIVDALSETPLIVEFDQSLDPASLGGAFELLDSIQLTPVPLLEPPALVGDGRVVVVSVLSAGGMSPLIPGNTYLLRFTDDQEIRDVTGQAFDFGTEQDIFEMGVTDMPPANPRVVYSYPSDNAILVSDLTEIVVVFDRRMNPNPNTFTNMSFEVTVDGVLTPLNPAPSSLVLTGLQVPVPVLQVWRWSHAEGNAPRQSLGADASVRVRLSPAGVPPLTGLPTSGGGLGGTLPQTDIEFTTALVRAPASVLKDAAAQPLDAIGIPDLESGGVLEVALADPAGQSDTLDVFIIGGSPANAELLKAEQRSVPIPPAALSVVLSEAELDLREPNGVARFRDGKIEFMTRVRRGSTATAARQADGDPSTTGFQPFVLDLTPPRLLGLGVDASSVSLVRSELGGIVIVGLGDEEIRFARVSTSAGDNHAGAPDPPATALASPGGRFIAVPVIGAPTVLASSSNTYTVEVFDRAMNPASNLPIATGVYEQLGTVGPGIAPAGGDVTVRVFDADTAAPLEGALVISHSDDGMDLTYLGHSTTMAGTGTTVVPSAGSGATVVTVQRAGYDSFTFHGVPVDRFDVPLPPAGVAPATISGVARRPYSIDVVANQNWVADSRTLQSESPLKSASIWVINAMNEMESTYGPFSVRAQRLGLTTHFATNPVPGTSGSQFLTSTALRLSDTPLAYGMGSIGQDLTVIAGTGSDSIAPHLLDISGILGFALQGGPTVTVEGVAPGLEGAPTVGLGNPASTSATTWGVLGATASTVGATLVPRGALEAGLHLRAEVADVEGNRIGARPLMSTSAGSLQPIAVPRLLLPASGGTTGVAYDLEVDDVVPDTLAMAGLYRVIVTDPIGQRWHLWAVDPPGDAEVRLALPPVSAQGGTPLASGQQSARVSAWAWPDLDPMLFLWADVERRYAVYAYTAPTSYTQN